MTPAKYAIRDAEEAKSCTNADDYIYEWTDDYAYFLVNTETNEIVFSDGGSDSPEDNFLYRHYGGLVDILNEEAAR